MLTDRSWTPALVASTKLEKGMRAMNENRKQMIMEAVEKLDNALSDLIDIKIDLEDQRCMVQAKKLDTINGKLYNLVHELAKKAR